MKRRISLESISAMATESFDSSPTGNVNPAMQGETPEQPLVTAGYNEAPFSGQENYAAEKFKERALAAIAQPPFRLQQSLEAEALVIDDDELEAFGKQCNGLMSLMDDSPVVSLEDAKERANKLAVAKNKMHGRFKKMFEGWADGWRSAGGLQSKYRKRLEELRQQLSGTQIHGTVDVNLSGLWQHFSNEAGPIHNNFIGKIKEDVAYSTYILADYSKQAYEQLKHLEMALHTGQGDSDEQAKRTALDVEKCEAPMSYLDHKWMCKAGEQPYLSVMGVYANQGRTPRPVALDGVSLSKLAQMATYFRVREYGSFTHGLKKLFVNSSKANVRLHESDLEQVIKLGEMYLDAVSTYLEYYHGCWAVFRRIDESLEMIWDDFDLTEWEVNYRGDDPDGSDDINVTWQTSGTGNITRRAALYEQLLDVVQNFSDAVLSPGMQEMNRALRAAKFHCYLLEAAFKVVKSAAMESMMVPPRLQRKMAQEFFWNNKPHQSAEYVAPKWKDIPKPQWDVNHPPSIQESVKTLRAAMQEHDPEGLKTFNRPATPQELQKLEALVKEHTGKGLPPELVELYKITNGGVDSYQHLRLFDFDEFMPIHEVISAYNLFLALVDDDWAGDTSEIETGMQGKRYWEPWWIPFTANGGGDHFCADVNPGAGGKVGQVIDWCHDFDGRRVTAPSIAAFLALSIHRQLYLLQHKKDWEAKNKPAEQK